MKKTILTLITLTILFAGCSKKNEPTPESKFKGEWTGTYLGGDEGGITIEINASGNINGFSYSSFKLGIDRLTGVVDENGEFQGSTESGSKFLGKINGTSANGTWSNATLKLNGTWKGSKKQPDETH